MTGQELLEIRQRLDMTQRAFGDAIGVTPTMVGYMERGYAANGRKVKVSRRTERTVLLLAESKGVAV